MLACRFDIIPQVNRLTFMFKVIQSLLPEASEWGDTRPGTHQDTRCVVVFGKLE